MSKSNLLIRPKGTTGLVHDVTPASAGWTYVGFALHKLAEGEVTGAESGARRTTWTRRPCCCSWALAWSCREAA